LTGRLRSTTVKLEEAVDLLSLVPRSSGVAWLTESMGLVASGPFVRLYPGTGPGRFERGSEQFRKLLEGAEIRDDVDLPGTGPVLFGSWTFDPNAPGSDLLVPTTIHGYNEGVSWRTDIELGPVSSSPAPGFDAEGDDSSEQEWIESVERALAAISSGGLEKVVLARQVRVANKEPHDQNAITRRLREAYPGCFTFCFENLVGASPELLVRRLDDVVDSIPLAGSAPRGKTEEEDEQLGQKLRESSKNLSEHALTVTSVMERLAPFCSELVSEPEPSLLLLANLQHLSTKVQGRLAGPTDSLLLAGALHPTAAVCGVPQQEALAIIRSSETFERGRYAGPIGWMDRHGDGEWALALRCASIEGNEARVFAGAGIVAGSDPAEELEETRLKLQAMLAGLGRTLKE
jgi:menaquinone-specific isochorismate synthase